MPSKRGRKKSRKSQGISELTKIMSEVTLLPRRKRQKRRKKQQQQPSKLGVAPTVQAVQAAQRAGNRKLDAKLAPYVKCRLNPFNSVMSRGIPDGSNSDYIVLDMLTYDTIVATTTAPINIQTFAALPAMAGVWKVSANTVSDFTINGAPYYGSNNTTGEGYYYAPIAVPQALRTLNYQPGNYTQDPWGATSLRLVAVAYKIIYTGQSSTCSGTITVTPNPVSYTVGPEQDVSLTFGTIQGFATGTPAGITLPRNTRSLVVDNPQIENSYNKSSYVARVEHGAFVRPTHSKNTFDNLPLSPEAMIVLNGKVANATATNSVLTSGYTDYNSTGVIWYDNDWGGANITIAGHQVGASFRVETAACFEAKLAVNSAFTPLAIKSSPNDPAQIQFANSAIASYPLGTSLAFEPGPSGMSATSFW